MAGNQQLKPGARVGSFQLVQALWTGEASQVWLATDLKTVTPVALKVLSGAGLWSPEHVRNLMHEATVGRRLDHPLVLAARATGTADGFPYLVMDYFAGQNLRERLHQAPAAWQARAAALLEAAAEALAHVHERGWVHRDVKPENFLINEAGGLRLIDFGLAERAAGWWARWFHSPPKLQGTRSYMAPEQIRRQAVDVRVDVYSLGCTAFHLLAGRPPFVADSSDELLRMHLGAQRPRLDAANPTVSREFSELISKMLAIEPGERPASMRAVLSELRSRPVFKQAPQPVAAAAATR